MSHLLKFFSAGNLDDPEMTALDYRVPRGIALGLSVDNFNPFSRQISTLGLLIPFNYNLSSETLSHQEKVTILGVIPGPENPIDVDSFIFPGPAEFGQ